MNPIAIVKRPKAFAKKAYHKVQNLYRTYFKQGEAVKCGNCGWNGSRFFDQKCPKCRSLPRTRLVPFALDYFNLINDNSRILHLAANHGEYLFVKSRVKEFSNYDRLDIVPFKHVNLVRDITDSGLEDAIYDLSIAWHIFEHIKEDEKAISEVYRVLKPGGKLLVSVPIYPEGNQHTFEDKNTPYEDYEKVYGHHDHCRSCGMDYYERFEEQGFITKTLEVKNLEDDVIDYHGLRRDHVVWCFEKPIN